MKKSSLTLFGSKGAGSAIVESAFVLTGLPYDYVELNYEPGTPSHKKLLKLNPLGQVPALKLLDGSVITESLAMITYAHKMNPKVGLIPAENTEHFWRWQCFIIAAIYPTFTYGDDPKKWVGEEAGPKLRHSTDEWRKKLWLQMEDAASDAFFMGDSLTSIDLYLTFMVTWRPGKKWFKENCPKLYSIASKTSKKAKLKELLKRHY